MNQQRAISPRVARFAIYIVLILLCMYPLFEFGRPSALMEDGNLRPGGVLSKIRNEAGLSEVQLGDIDPASSTVKLATLGLRGVAITMLWHQSQEFEKRKDWNNVIATSNQIIRLEPHFVSIWEFLGWKLSYNASAEFDDYRERYRWLIRGFDFIVEGTRFNRHSPILFHKAGWVISQKIGIADEKEQYRRLLRQDEEFHTRYHTPSEADRDNWLIGRKWYHDAENLVHGEGRSIGKQSEPLFFSHSRMNLIHYATWLATDGKFGEDGKGEEIKKHWQNAADEWFKFGQITFKTAIPMGRDNPEDPDKIWETTLLGFWEIDAQERELISKLRNLIPGLYEKTIIENWDRLLDRTNGEELQASVVYWLENSEEEEAEILRKHLDETRPDWKEQFTQIRDQTRKRALRENAELADIPELLRSEQETAIVTKADGAVSQLTQTALGDLKLRPIDLADKIQGSPEIRAEALSIREQLQKKAREKHMSNLFRGIINYPYREREVIVEQQDERIQGRRYLFEARRSFRDGEQKEANRLWLNAMGEWEKLINKEGFEDVGEDPQFSRDVLELLERYVIILDAEESLFPETFPLQQYARNHVQEDYFLKGARAAAAYSEKIYNQGDYSKALEYLEKTVRQYGGLNSSIEYMKSAPFPEIRDEILHVYALYVNCLMKENRPLPRTGDVELFVEIILRNDPMQLEATEQSRDAMVLMSAAEPDYAQAQEKFEQAMETWKKVLDKYPVLYLDRNSYHYGNLVETAVQYLKSLELQGKPIPEDFPLKRFLQ